MEITESSMWNKNIRILRRLIEYKRTGLRKKMKRDKLTVRKKESTCSHIIVHDTHFCSLFYCTHIWQSYYSSTIEISKSYHIMSYHYLFTIFSNSQARQQPSKALIVDPFLILLFSHVCLFIYCASERSHKCDTQQSGPEQLIQAPWFTWIVEWSIPNFLHVRLMLDMAFWFEDVQWTLSATCPWLIHQIWRSYNKHIISPEKEKKCNNQFRDLYENLNKE